MSCSRLRGSVKSWQPASELICWKGMVMTVRNYYYSIAELNLGRVGLVWVDEGLPRLVRVMLPGERLSTADLVEESYPGAIPRSHSLIDEIGLALQEYD